MGAAAVASNNQIPAVSSTDSTEEPSTPKKSVPSSSTEENLSIFDNFPADIPTVVTPSKSQPTTSTPLVHDKKTLDMLAKAKVEADRAGFEIHIDFIRPMHQSPKSQIVIAFKLWNPIRKCMHWAWRPDKWHQVFKILDKESILCNIGYYSYAAEDRREPFIKEIKNEKTGKIIHLNQWALVTHIQSKATDQEIEQYVLSLIEEMLTDAPKQLYVEFCRESTERMQAACDLENGPFWICLKSAKNVRTLHQHNSIDDVLQTIAAETIVRGMYHIPPNLPPSAWPVSVRKFTSALD